MGFLTKSTFLPLDLTLLYPFLPDATVSLEENTTSITTNATNHHHPIPPQHQSKSVSPPLKISAHHSAAYPSPPHLLLYLYTSHFPYKQNQRIFLWVREECIRIVVVVMIRHQWVPVVMNLLKKKRRDLNRKRKQNIFCIERKKSDRREKEREKEVGFNVCKVVKMFLCFFCV